MRSLFLCGFPNLLIVGHEKYNLDCSQSLSHKAGFPTLSADPVLVMFSMTEASGLV